MNSSKNKILFDGSSNEEQMQFYLSHQTFMNEKQEDSMRSFLLFLDCSFDFESKGNILKEYSNSGVHIFRQGFIHQISSKCTLDNPHFQVLLECNPSQFQAKISYLS